MVVDIGFAGGGGGLAGGHGSGTVGRGAVVMGWLLTQQGMLWLLGG